ncbi:unnamed protein product [Paramecium octaurelia]|uniref:Uncharacterized protein n=1 Tax=Paramecium octaurelia TaxID=43137 RepID=A0A8S1TVP4_PAROT|nr:unnamed protein product [Paramecium octaurelia]
MDDDQRLQNISNQLDRMKFEFKIKFEKQSEILEKQSKILEANSQKIQQLEQQINDLQVDNSKKQQEIDSLKVGQNKLTNDFKKIWNNLSSVLKIQREESQMKSTLSAYQEQSTLQQDQSSQTKQFIQQEFQSRFLLIKDTLLKKSEFNEYSQKVEEQFETLRQQLQTFTQHSSPDIEFRARKESISSKPPQFQFQYPPFKGDAQAMKQQLEKKEQVQILSTQYQDK